MRKEVIMFVVLLLIMPIVSAAPQLVLQQDSYQEHETIIGKITGSVISIPLENIKFYEGRKEVFIEHGATSHDGVTYFYAYPSNEGNFTIVVESVLYEKKGITRSKDLEQNFLVKNVNNSAQVLSVRPGFISTSSTENLSLVNRGTESLSVSVGEEEIVLDSQKTRKISVIPNETFSYFNITSYETFSVPVIFVNLSISNPGEDVEEDLESIIEIEGKNITLQVTENSSVEGSFILRNPSNDSVIISFFTYNDAVEIVEDITIKNNSQEIVLFTFNSGDDGYYQEEILLGLGKSDETVFVNVLVFPEEIVVEEGVVIDEGGSCEDQGGNLCTVNEKCDTGNGFFLDGYCCLGSCIPLEEDSSKAFTDFIIGGVIILLLIAIIYFIRKKVKSVQPEERISSVTKSKNVRKKKKR